MSRTGRLWMVVVVAGAQGLGLASAAVGGRWTARIPGPLDGLEAISIMGSDGDDALVVDLPFRVMAGGHVSLHTGVTAAFRNDAVVEAGGSLVVVAGSVRGCVP